MYGDPNAGVLFRAVRSFALLLQVSPPPDIDLLGLGGGTLGGCDGRGVDSDVFSSFVGAAMPSQGVPVVQVVAQCGCYGCGGVIFCSNWGVGALLDVSISSRK